MKEVEGFYEKEEVKEKALKKRGTLQNSDGEEDEFESALLHWKRWELYNHTRLKPNGELENIAEKTVAAWQKVEAKYAAINAMQGRAAQQARASNANSGSNAVNFVHKDHNGFLWCSTANGLNRFDGNAFDVFTNNPADSTTIASNDIQTIYEDSRQQLWIGTLSGISLYYPHTQRFSNYSPDTTVCKPGRTYRSIIEDKQGKLWIASAYELLIFDPVTKRFSRSGWADFINRKIAPEKRMTDEPAFYF